MQLLDVRDWVELIQLVLFPAVKDTLNNLMSVQWGRRGWVRRRHISALPRGAKLSSNSVVQSIIEVGVVAKSEAQTVKEVFTSRLQDVIADPGFSGLWLNVGLRGVCDPTVLQCREVVHSISQPNGELYEYNTLTITSLIRTLNALDCFSVGGGEGDDS